jgi:ribosomal protein S27E
LTRYVECGDCGFVLVAAESTDPAPKRWQSCPDCGRADFGFADD